MVKGSSRSYGDVSNETANYLTNVPNYRAYCKLIEGAELAEYFVAGHPCETPKDRSLAERVKARSPVSCRHR